MKHLLLVALILSGSIPSVWAAQLDAKILVEDQTISPTFSFLRVVYIEYPEGGEIAQLLQGKNQNITITADSDTPGMEELINQINENLESLPSTVFVTDSKVNYQAVLNGNQNSAVIEFKIQLIPTFTNPVISKQDNTRTIDANWRGLTLNSPVFFDTQYGSLDINSPKNALDVMIPDVMEKFENSDVEILRLPMIDSSGILELPIYKWHSLFDNTAIMEDAKQFNYSGKYVLTHYSMGECNLFDGVCDDREWIKELKLDKNYKILIVESRDDASITIEGYSEPSSLGAIEVFEANLVVPVNNTPGPGVFPESVMYGMAAMAAIGGVAMFFFSSRKLKQDQNQGQTGIDPAHLIVYDTSNSAGGYKTNRGESYLAIKQKSKTPVSH